MFKRIWKFIVEWPNIARNYSTVTEPVDIEYWNSDKSNPQWVVWETALNRQHAEHRMGWLNETYGHVHYRFRIKP